MERSQLQRRSIERRSTAESSGPSLHRSTQRRTTDDMGVDQENMLDLGSQRPRLLFRGRTDDLGVDQEFMLENNDHRSDGSDDSTGDEEVQQKKSSCWEDLRLRVLLFAGIRLSKDKKCVFNYNPRKYQAFANCLLVLPLLPSSGLVWNTASICQGFFLMIVAHLWALHGADGTQSGKGFRDSQVESMYTNGKGICQFVLGLYVSMVLAHTYYANRKMFGTVFGSSMGLAQMVVAWVQAPNDTPGGEKTAEEARDLLIRWINACFRLMWLECKPGVPAEEIGQDMLDSGLLTPKEWEHILELPSRCTHIYQWMNNVLRSLCMNGYFDSIVLVTMNKQVDAMRAANVWGLPSLPLPYTIIVTHMVKLYLLLLALFCGVELHEAWMAHLDHAPDHTHWFTLVRIYFSLFIHNYLIQGLLDLHGVLYSPNSGTLLGHMPAVNFLDFVRSVTQNLNNYNCQLPYSLHVTDVRAGRGSV